MHGIRLTSILLAPILALGACDSQPAAPSTDAADAPTLATARGGRAAATGVVFVTSQGLYYDTFVTQDPLPMVGEFQLLDNGQT
jgi:hypothetical protein